MKKLIILVGLVGVLSSCSKPRLENAVLIRIDNQTDKQLDDVSIFSYSSDGDGQTEVEKKYGSVHPRIASHYELHREVYNFPLFKFIMPGYGLFEIRDIRCGMGVAPLVSGKYSLIIHEADNYPYVRLVKE